MKKLLVAAAILSTAGIAEAQDFQWPVGGTVTQGFFDSFSGIDPGYYYDQNSTQQYFQGYNVLGYKMHRAIDIACNDGTPVHAARDGTVKYYGYPTHFYGYYAIVAHSNGYATLYAHLSSFALSNGAGVSTGQIIAYSGHTGNVTGPHCHFEIRHTTNSVNYAPYTHYVPASNVGVGNTVPFDYPGIGPIGGGGAPAAPGGLYAAAQSGTSIYFQWNASSGAQGYWLDIAKSYSDLVNMVGTFQNHFNGTATSFTWTGLSPGTTYYWRVWAYNSYGGNHGYPSGPVTTPNSVSPPATPVIYSPYNGQTVSSSPVGLDWSDVGGIDYYYYAVYSGGTLVAQGWPTSSTASVGLTPGSFTWYVWAHNSAGWSGQASASFTLAGGATVPGKPGGLSPNNWASMSGSSVTLSWWGVSGATSYDVLIYYWNGSSWVYYYTYTTGSSYLTFWPQVHYSYYAWAVQAKNIAGGTWSDWAYFYYNN